jgi:hypothetical protein
MFFDQHMGDALGEQHVWRIAQHNGNIVRDNVGGVLAHWVSRLEAKSVE